jgi:hypothetical protein
MLRYFRVEAYPDEELCSLLTRSVRRVGLGSAEFVRWYFGPPAIPLTSISNLVPLIAEFLDSTPRQVVQNQTLVYYGTAALPPQESRRTTIDLISGRVPKMHHLLGKLSRRWCAVCVRRDVARFGESYWHRCHLLPGVSTCVEHGTPLLQRAEPVQMRTIQQAVTYWLRDGLPHEEPVGTPVDLALPFDLAHQLSLWSARVLKRRRALPDATICPADWRAVFTPELIHAAGCRGSSISRLPPTTAYILSIIAQRRLKKLAAGTQLELPL